MAIRVIQVGLGPIGRQVTRYLLEREEIELVAAFDSDPGKHGRDIGELDGRKPLGVRVSEWDSAPGSLQADVAVLSTVSRLELAAPQLLEIASLGLHVVSTCEELVHPWRTSPEWAQRIDAAARKAGVAVLGTGINPGFLMDCLPAMASGLCRSVGRVRVERVQDASLRRRPFQEKIGAGLTVAEFQRRAESGVLRHVGLTESMHLLAEALNWILDRTEDNVRPVMAQRETSFGEGSIPVGGVLGVHQQGRGFISEQEVIRLEFQASIAEPSPHDSIHFDAAPPISLVIPGGVHGDIGTCALTVNAVDRVRRAQPGLRTMLDVGVVSCRARRAMDRATDPRS